MLLFLRCEVVDICSNRVKTGSEGSPLDTYFRVRRFLDLLTGPLRKYTSRPSYILTGLRDHPVECEHIHLSHAFGKRMRTMGLTCGFGAKNTESSHSSVPLNSREPTVLCAYIKPSTPHHRFSSHRLCTPTPRPRYGLFHTILSVRLLVFLHVVTDREPVESSLLACDVWYVDTIMPHFRLWTHYHHYCLAARSSILSFLHRITISGHIRIEDSDGIYDYGTKSVSACTVHVRVIDSHFWTRVLL